MTRRILLAGLGNIFLGDDAFGVEVARHLLDAGAPVGVEVREFGIRGFDLAFALMADWDLVVLIDALPRGGVPGSVYVLEPDLAAVAFQDEAEAAQGHGLTPERVLGLVQALGGELSCAVRVVGCEPLTFGSDDEPALALSAPVRAAVPEAAMLIHTMLRSYQQEHAAVPPHVGGSDHGSDFDGAWCRRR